MIGNIDPDEVIYRLCSEEDLPVIAQMYQRLDQVYRELGYNFPAVEDVGEKWLAGFRRTLGRFSILYVAEVQGEIVGFSTARIKRAPEFMGGSLVGELKDLWIEPKVRRLRIGDRLLRMATEWCLAQEVESIEAQYFVLNQASDQLLQNLGFKTELIQMRLMKGEYKQPDE